MSLSKPVEGGSTAKFRKDVFINYTVCDNGRNEMQYRYNKLNTGGRFRYQLSPFIPREVFCDRLPTGWNELTL